MNANLKEKKLRNYKKIKKDKYRGLREKKEKNLLILNMKDIIMKYKKYKQIKI